MKVTTKPAEKQFEPIELTITIESKEELNFLLAVFNRGASLLDFVNQPGNGYGKFDYVPNELDKTVWYELDKLTD